MKSVYGGLRPPLLIERLVDESELDCGHSLIVEDGSLGGCLGYSGESGVADGDGEGLVALVETVWVVGAVVEGGDRDDGG